MQKSARPRQLAAGTPPENQAQAFAGPGYDLELSCDQRYAEIIASADDLEELQRLGYSTVVVRDLTQN